MTRTRNSQSSEQTAPTHSLEREVDALPGIGPKRAKLLAKLGIHSILDLLLYLPKNYQDRTALTPIARLSEGETATILAEVIESRQIRMRGRLSMTEVLLRDETGEVRATWFGRGYLAKTFAPGRSALFSGVVGKYKGLALKNPDYELVEGNDEDAIHTGCIVPMYRLTEKVSQRMLRRWIHDALETMASSIPDRLPVRLRSKHRLPTANSAVRAAHFPDTMESASQARTRFAYEELLGIQLSVLKQRALRKSEHKSIRHTISGPRLLATRQSLPFRLTRDQQRAVENVLSDMASPHPMVRLLQGDVGCGKTVVAIHAIAAACDGGYQTALMAPTEVLADQHFRTLQRYASTHHMRCEILTGSTRNASSIRKDIASGAVDVIVGTHALIQESVAFHALGLVIIDEQHRFGVLQRSALAEKGLHTDVLHMTATPIPRTLCLTLYGGMDITLIDELPPGRLPIKTRCIPNDKLAAMHRYVCEQAALGFQTYVICPLIEESDSRKLTSVKRHFEALAGSAYSSLRTALLHGRLAGDEKDSILTAFRDGLIDVLFSTSVIEVGIDVPNATTMIIEDAAQFGMTQLHQLRGRIGRGAEQAYCFLIGSPSTDDGKRRLEVLCRTSSGFELAEEDLRMRGPGEFFGVHQTGLSDLRAADLVRDIRLLDATRRDAMDILRADSSLAKPDNAGLAELTAAASEFLL